METNHFLIFYSDYLVAFMNSTIEMSQQTVDEGCQIARVLVNYTLFSSCKTIHSPLSCKRSQHSIGTGNTIGNISRISSFGWSSRFITVQIS